MRGGEAGKQGRAFSRSCEALSCHSPLQEHPRVFWRGPQVCPSNPHARSHRPVAIGWPWLKGRPYCASMLHPASNGPPRLPSPAEEWRVCSREQGGGGWQALQGGREKWGEWGGGLGVGWGGERRRWRGFLRTS